MGSGKDRVCASRDTTTRDATPGAMVSSPASGGQPGSPVAELFANTSAYVDTVLRPTPTGVESFEQIRDSQAPGVGGDVAGRGCGCRRRVERPELSGLGRCGQVEAVAAVGVDVGVQHRGEPGERLVVDELGAGRADPVDGGLDLAGVPDDDRVEDEREAGGVLVGVGVVAELVAVGERDPPAQGGWSRPC